MNRSTYVSTNLKYVFTGYSLKGKILKMHHTKETDRLEMQGVHKPPPKTWKVETERCNNCVYPPQKREKGNSCDSCQLQRVVWKCTKEKRGRRKINGSNTIMKWCSKNSNALEALVHRCKPHSTRILNFLQSKVGFYSELQIKKCSCTLGIGFEIFRSLGLWLVCSLFVSDPPGTFDGWALWAVVYLMAHTVSRITAPIATLWPRMSWRSW